MKKWIMLTSIALLLLSAGIVGAQGFTGGNQDEGWHPMNMSQDGDPVHKRIGKKHGCNDMNMGAHMQMYFTLLAEKYTPDDVDEWQAALAEHKELMTELRSLKSSVDKKEMKPDDSFRENMSQFRDLHQKFTEAVETGNEEQIKALLPQILEQKQAMNETLKKKLDEMKESM